MTWDINGAGDVVGYVRDYVETKNGGYTLTTQRCVYGADQDIVIDLNNLITGEAFDTWNVIAAYGINDVDKSPARSSLMRRRAEAWFRLRFSH